VNRLELGERIPYRRQVVVGVVLANRGEDVIEHAESIMA
jgi:hypothetical protein